MAIQINDLLPLTPLSTLTGKSVMIHDVSQPLANVTTLASLDDLKIQIQKETQNGLVITGGNTELGGDVIHPTTLNLNDNQLTFLNSPLSGFGYYPFGTLKQSVLIENLNNNIAYARASVDTTIGDESLYSSIILKDNPTGGEYGFQNSYNPNTSIHKTYWQRYDGATDSRLTVDIDPSLGLNIQPFLDGGTQLYVGENLFTVKLPNTNTVFTIKANGRINAVLPSYADDIAAGIGGLSTGDVYQASGIGMNAQGTLMIKQ